MIDMEELLKYAVQITIATIANSNIEVDEKGAKEVASFIKEIYNQLEKLTEP